MTLMRTPFSDENIRIDKSEMNHLDERRSTYALSH